MQNVITQDEVVKWEYMITKTEKLVATNKRLYRMNTAGTKISVLFRKAILGCDYSFTNTWLVAYILLALGVISFLGAGDSDAAAGVGVLFLLSSLFFMCKIEKLSIKVSGEGDVKLYKAKWFSPKYQPTLIEKIPDISALEDV